MKIPMIIHLKDPSSVDSDGNLYPGDMEDVEHEWCTKIDECDHTYTACIQCLGDWACEWDGVIKLEGYPDITLEQVIFYREFARLIPEVMKVVQGILTIDPPEGVVFPEPKEDT